MIPESKRKFGEFGEGVETIHDGRTKRSWLQKLFILCFVIAIPLAWFFYQRIYLKFFENEAPTVEVLKSAGGVGRQEIDIKIRAHDSGSGLDEIVFKADQGSRPIVIKRIKVPQGGNASSQVKEYKVSIDGQKLGFRPGDVRILIIAFDRSFWSNKFIQEVNLKVDYEAPEVRPVTTQHNAVHGGVQLVMYKVRDGKNKKFNGLSGIQLGDWLFPGFPAKELDPDFEGQENLFFTFFPVPLSFDPDKRKIRLFARDDVGNFGTSSFYYAVRKINPKKRKYTTQPELLDLAASKFYKKYLNHTKGAEYTDATSDEEKVKRYKLVNEDYRKEVEKHLSSYLAKPKSKKYWQNKFAKFPGFTYIYNFNEVQSYSHKGQDAGTVLSTGTGFFNKASDTIRSTNDGIVIFSDSLGIKGQTVIVDHGLGLTTHYSNLDASSSAKEGTKVARGDVLGKIGNTGLFKDNLFHYEVRMHGVPVRPEEWWDERWIKGHILNKIKHAKRDLRIKEKKKL